MYFLNFFPPFANVEKISKFAFIEPLNGTANTKSRIRLIFV